VYVCGRNFVPAPATGIIAFIFLKFMILLFKKDSEYSECFAF
jgi:hypothetical protein